MASLGVYATCPRGTATPNLANTCLAWYSWIFILFVLSSSRPKARDLFFSTVILVAIGDPGPLAGMTTTTLGRFHSVQLNPVAKPFNCGHGVVEHRLLL